MKVYALSDQHHHLHNVRVPECDLLLVGGDNFPDYPPGARDRVGSGPQTRRQLDYFTSEWLTWRAKQPAKNCVVCFGNHDYCGETLHANKESHVKLNDATTSVVDGLVEVDGLKIWLTPWSSQFRDWAFMAEDWWLLDHYKAIPEGIDILVSHQPPKGYGDGASAYDLSTGKMQSLGSQALLETILRVKPKVVICGHIHSGHGMYHMDICDKHGVDAKSCECHTFHQVTVYNVALVNEQYEMVHQPTEIVV